MTRFLRRLAATIAVAFFPLAAAAVATSAVTVAAPGAPSPKCDPKWSHNPVTGECHPPPPPPDMRQPLRLSLHLTKDAEPTRKP